MLADDLPMIAPEFFRGVQSVAEAGWMTEKTQWSQPAAISFRWLAFNEKLAGYQLNEPLITMPVQ